MSEIERSNRLPANLQNSAEGAQNPQTELQERVFGLVTDFKSAFRSSKDFKEALAQTYLGQLDYGYEIKPEDARKVEIMRGNGNIYWAVTYSFTEDNQTLVVERMTDVQTDTPTTETITLQSKRFDGQVPTGGIKYFKQAPPEGAEPMAITRHRDNPVALRNAKQILNDFKAGR